MEKNKTLMLIMAFVLVILMYVGVANAYYVETWTSGGESTSFANATIQSGSYVNTTIDDGDFETITEVLNNTYYVLKWNYDFNTTYNETTPPIELMIITDVRTFEKMNISIYNYNTGLWEYLNETTVLFPSWDTTQTTITKNGSINTSDYIDQSSGQIKILFEDTIKDSDTVSDSNLYLDYLAINATISYHLADWFNLTNLTGSVYSDGQDFYRGQALNASAHWNTSSIIGASVLINDSQTGLQQEYNITGLFAGNYTNYTINLSNTSMFPAGANYTVKIKAKDSYYQENTTYTTHWFYLWSNANVTEMAINESANGSSSTIANGTSFKIMCMVLDNESNYSVSGYNVSFYANGSYIGSNLTNSTGWALHNYTDNSTGPGNYTLECNITNQSDIFYGDSVGNASMLLTVITDPYEPLINSVWFQEQNVNTAEANLYANLTVYANITDNLTYVASANVTINYPNGTVANATMTQNTSGSDIWYFVFYENDTGPAINQTGAYNISITAFDVSGNSNQSSNSTFTAYSNYTVHMADYYQDVLYNRGENLTLHVLDVNNLTVLDVNWTVVNITKFGQNETNLTSPSGNTSTFFIYAINTSDPVGNWTLFANVSKNGNTGNRTFYFNVSSILYPYFTSPAGGSSFSRNVDINDIETITVKVNYSRNITTNYTMNITLECPYANFTLNKSAGLNTHFNTSGVCYSPGSAGEFAINVYASDSYNNTGFGSVTLTATAPVQIPGGSGYIPAGDTGPSCSCGNWTDINCSPTGGCPEGYMYQTRICTPSGCTNESQCVPFTGCVLKRDFSITLNKQNVTMDSGTSSKVIITLNNTGEANLTLNITIEKQCCDLSLTSMSVNISEQDFQEFPLDINSSLLQVPGNYSITIKARWKWGGDSGEEVKTITVNINRNPLLDKLDILWQDLGELEARIQEYAASGLGVAALQNSAEEIRQALDEANDSIAANQINVLESRINFAFDRINNIRKGISGLEMQKLLFDYKWYIIGGIIAVFILSYLATQVIVPYYRLGKEIRALRSKEKAQVQGRVVTEKDYFSGRMTEEAFNKILMEKQTKILDTRGKLRQKLEERSELIKSRLTPRAVGKWIKSGLKRLLRKKE